MSEAVDIDTDQIKNWRSIITLIVFVITSECMCIMCLQKNEAELAMITI
jgi:hypothetical protein